MTRLLAILLLSTGCAVAVDESPSPEQPPGPPEKKPALQVDQVWTDDPDLAPYVEQAMQRWTAATGREWRFEPGPRVVRFGTPPTGYIGWNDGTTVVLKDTWRGGEWLDRLVLHELGHYYPTETEHSDRPGVMTSGLGATCITRSDVRHLCVSDICRAENPEC